MTKGILVIFVCFQVYSLEIPLQFRNQKGIQNYPKLENNADLEEYRQNKRIIEEHIGPLKYPLVQVSSLRKWYEAQFIWDRRENLFSFTAEERCKQKYNKKYDKNGERPLWNVLNSKAKFNKLKIFPSGSILMIVNKDILSAIWDPRLKLKIRKKDNLEPRVSENMNPAFIGRFRDLSLKVYTSFSSEELFTFTGRKIISTPENNPLLSLVPEKSIVEYPNLKILKSKYAKLVPSGNEINYLENISNYLIDKLETDLARASIKEKINLISDFYYEFMSIHPFFNGNGRTGQILISSILERENLPVPISLYFGEDAFLKKEDFREIFYNSLQISMLFHQELVFLITNKIPIWFAQSHYFTPADKFFLDKIKKNLEIGPYQLVPVSTYSNRVPIKQPIDYAYWLTQFNENQAYLTSITTNYFTHICKGPHFPTSFVQSIIGPIKSDLTIPKAESKSNEILNRIKFESSVNCSLDIDDLEIKIAARKISDLLLDKDGMYNLATFSYDETKYPPLIPKMTLYLENCMDKPNFKGDLLKKVFNTLAMLPILYLLQKRNIFPTTTNLRLVILFLDHQIEYIKNLKRGITDFYTSHALNDLSSFFSNYAKAISIEIKNNRTPLPLFDAAVIYGWTLTFGKISFTRFNSGDEDMKKLVLQLISSMAQLPELKGEEVKELYSGLGQDIFKNFSKNNICLGGFISTSYSKNIAISYVKRNSLDFLYLIPIETRSYGKDISIYSKFSSEKEVIFPPGINFIFQKNEYNPKGPHKFLVTMKEGPENPYRSMGKCK